MKWFVVTLVILNIAVYLLGQKLNPEAPEFTASGQHETINPELMSVIEPGRNGTSVADKASDGQMLEEEGLAQLKMDTRGQVLMAPTVAPKIEEEDSAPIIVAGDPSQSRESIEEQAPIPAVAQAETEEVSPGDRPATPEPAAEAEKPALSCYRLGPFGNQKSLASARRKLEKQGIAYSVDEDRDNQKIKAIRVYLGAFTSDNALQEEKKRLDSMGIEHFVIRLNSTPMIQLGYFSEPERAMAYQEKLQARGLQVKTERIYHDAAISSWLVVREATREAIDSLALPGGMIKQQPACP